MPLDIVRGAIKNQAATIDLVNSLKSTNYFDLTEGTLFLGYPLAATADSKITIDALLITKDKGMIAFIYRKPNVDFNEEQDLLFYQISNTLMSYETLRAGRKLAFDPVIITYFPDSQVPSSNDIYNYADNKTLIGIIENIPKFNEIYYERLIEALQKISTMKPKKKRLNVIKESSKGSIMKEIEKQTANLDEWQKKAAFEIPENPQRVRGLAGSGKTVVLALKAAYLHSQYPDWNIAVTFYSRALSQQFKDMITNFSQEFLKDEPDWNKLHVLHAWGTSSEEGIYSIAAKQVNIIPVSFQNAKARFGVNESFEGICKEVVNEMGSEEYPLFDAILIDEAQDMPSIFFKLCYLITKNPKRIVFAYDELQNLGYNSMPSLEEMFGTDIDGNPLVSLKNDENEARQDIVLPICYRNTPWALTLAHSLGFGIYRNEGLVQLFSDLDLWTEIGYKKISGSLEYGEKVKLVRRDSSSPQYFKDLIDSQEAVTINKFSNRTEQYKWVADQIEYNIKEEELDPDDILVIFPDTYYAKSDYTEFRKYLIRKGIGSFLAGVDSSRDTFKVKDSITCSHIYRAKGNEAPMVYIVNSDFCAQHVELRKIRNILFTAITRSRAWVRICGSCAGMDIIETESKRCIENSYSLEFNIPTVQELEQINLIHRDRTEKEIKDIEMASKMVKELKELMEKGIIDTNVIPELNSLFNTFNSKKMRDDYDNSEDE